MIKKLFVSLKRKGAFAFIPDKLYYSLTYRIRCHGWMDWNNPTTFAEKLNWLKQFDRQSFYHTLVDKYEAYQSLDDEWQKIAIDLEIISTEGIEACRKVEPNLVMKGKDEVQDGWKGRIMDFALVQKMYFASELENIEEQNRKLEAKSSVLAELIPETEEGEEEIELTDEQKKQQKKLNDEAKAIRKEIAKLTKELEEKTIKKIEGLTDSEINALLEEKWILPLCTSLNEMPGKVVDDFISSLTKMTEKYSETLSSIGNEIKQTQQELFELMDELTGNDFDMKGLENLKGILA